MKKNFVLLILLSVGCGQNINIDNYNWNTLRYGTIPDTVKFYFLETLRPQDDSDSAYLMWGEDFVINLDSPQSSFSWERTGNHGFYPGRTYFKVNGVNYYHSNSSDRIASPPFILYNNELYFCNSKNLNSIEEVLGARYVKLSLNSRTAD